MQYVLGIIAILAGAGMVIKTEWIVQNFGTNAWAEEHLGYNGGSRFMYKMLGVLVIIVGFMLVTNMWESFLIGTVGKVFPTLK